MRILLGSKNPSKKRALEKALEKLEMEAEIISFDAQSRVHSKPIGYEIIRGADNRNQDLKKIAKKKNIDFDYLCSIEGGFSLDENGLPFVVTYCIIEDDKGRKSTGKSLGIRITKRMFDFVKDGGSLNKIIEQIIGTENNKQKQGITGYLTDGLYEREDIDSEAVISSLVPLIYQEKRDLLDQKILELSINRRD